MPHGEMNKYKNGIVVLNVGGSLFTSSVSTLVNSSSYFERRLSEEWRDEDSCGEDAILIDQDPSLFSVLLSYMRLGSIEDNKLTTPVILLAIFFGMEELLKATRTFAIRSRFEERNLGLFLSAQAALLVKDSDVVKQFASLTICHPDFVSFKTSRGIEPDFVVFVEIQNENGTVEIPPNCLTFIDALNLLNKSGYTRYEEEKLEFNEGYCSCLVRMWFSKLVKTSDDGDLSDCNSLSLSETNAIRESAVNVISKKHPREFCCIIENRENDGISNSERSILEADIGNEERQIEFSGPYEIFGTTAIGRLRSVILWNINSKIKKYNWLQNEGYTTNEDELASAYAMAVNILKPKEGHNSIVSVWSRSLEVKLLKNVH